jgi:hypothetical protein
MYRSFAQLLSIFRARHGCSVALSLAVCRWLKSEFVWMCSPIRQPPPMHAHSLARPPRLLRSGHASVLLITDQDAAEHACKRAREHVQARHGHECPAGKESKQVDSLLQVCVCSLELFCCLFRLLCVSLSEFV